MPQPVIFHIDVNSAYLSWEALRRKKDNPDSIDLRSIPSAIGGSQENRHGIILSKSAPAKKYSIITGEPIVQAMKKCPELIVVSPDFDLYVENSDKFIGLLKKYAPVVEQFSIDEAFCDMSGTYGIYGDPVAFAHKLKDTIAEELNFTVNIGISSNRVLAKMASDFKKPNFVHTLFPDEIKDKMWPLPVNELYFVGSSTYEKLNALGIHTIGELASCDKRILASHLKKHGELIWDYANGLDTGYVTEKHTSLKGYGNSTTLSFDVTDASTAKNVLLSLCETIGARIRADKANVGVISVTIVDSDFKNSSRQFSLDSPTNITELISEHACQLFDQLWDNAPIRLLGVSTSRATSDSFYQYNLFETDKNEKLMKLNSAIDSIRSKYGDDCIKRACFVDSQHEHMPGTLSKRKHR